MSNGKQIADTTLAQLGGNRFVAMTGAKMFTFDGFGRLTFRLPANFARDGINAVSVALNGSDLYDIKFMKIRGVSLKVIHEETNVYAEDLQREFTRATGLDTNMGRIRA